MQQKPDRGVMDYVAVPKNSFKLHKLVTLVEDVMFVNGATFLIAMPRGIKFLTLEHIPTRTAKQLIIYLKQVMIIYPRSGIIVQTVLIHMAFYKTIY